MPLSARSLKPWSTFGFRLDERSIGNGPDRLKPGTFISARSELSTIGRHWEGWNTRRPKILGLLILAMAVLTRPKGGLLGSSKHVPRAIQWSKPTVPTPAACAVEVIDGPPALKGAQIKRDRPTCIKKARNDIAHNALSWDGSSALLAPAPWCGQQLEPRNETVHERICTRRIAPKELNPC